MKKLLSLFLSVCLIFVFCLIGCKDKSNNIYIVCPDGAPALSLTLVMKNNYENVKTEIVNSQKIGGYITGENPKADICVLPINMASKLVGDGKTYKMLGTITHGNFYFLSKKNISVNSLNLNELIGKTIGVIQLKNVPGLTLKYSLKNKNVPFTEISDINNKSSDKVNLLPISLMQLKSDDIDLFLVPSPTSDIQISTTPLNLVGSLQEIYNGKGFPQAIIVVKNSLINNNPKLIKSVLADLENCNEFLTIENKDIICNLISKNLESGLTPVFTKENLTQNTIDNSSIKFVSIKENKDEVNSFIQNLKSVDDSCVDLFNETFFHLGDLWKKAPLNKPFYIRF